MKNLSVTTFIHILFSLAISALIATTIIFLSWDKASNRIKEINHYKLIADAFLSKVQLNPSKEKLEKLYNDFSVKPVSKEKIKEEITSSGKTIFTGQSVFGQVRVFQTPTNHYIYIQRLGYNIMLKDNRPPKYTLHLVVSISIILIILLLALYLAILKKLYPLKKLHMEIERFAKGETDIDMPCLDNNDEIGKIAKSFDHAIKHINQLTSSKNLFMRNIMHELKTPITKGRIIVESIDDDMIKEILIRAFNRMNELITELAQIERVTTQNFEPLLEYHNLSEVLQKSKDMLMVDESKMSITYNDFRFKTDIRLLSLAIKNLLDNGIKYGGSVEFKATFKSIEIISKGRELEEPLEYYIEPFSQEQKRKSGFGLGLYIVYSILDKLNYKLEYRYNDGKNIFEIVL
ncbi:HISTIDINE KINASE SENSOR PROTEIN [hydrothermal vent metagenome]|uniref:histidine kinase n=1 Tax=hydrothermal vent metagenome TaxID=652676 RepID=A0A1W1EJU1_9ZZZZ